MLENTESQIILCETAAYLGEQLNGWLKDDFLLLADENTATKCLPVLQIHFAVNAENMLVIPAGEGSKCLETAEKIWTAMLQSNLSRQGVLICLGGGVVSDLGGFCASTYKRGIPFINIPTSLLGMADAAIGGKTGINLNRLKNMVGTFHLPEAVLILPEFLNTLPPDEILNGWAEMVKHALIADADEWGRLRLLQKLETPSPERIFQAALLKQHVIKKDYQETDFRKILNFGHTLGHALESVYATENKKLAHGIAVAAGMKMEAHICHQLGILRHADYIEISSFIDHHFPKVKVCPIVFHQIISAARADKKSSAEHINIAGISQPGKAIPSIRVTEKQMLISLEAYLGEGLND